MRHGRFWACLLLAILVMAPAARAEGEKRPFPQNPTYRNGTMFALDDKDQMIDTVRRLYDEWKAKYFRHSPYNPDQAYIYWANEPGITVSEAHGYGMLALAYMAGYDPDAHKDFDSMVRYCLAHPSAINPALMAWQQEDDGKRIVDINGVDSATDGDLDIAYALLLANEQWGSGGEFNYQALALKSINATMDSVVNQEDWILLLGDWADDPAGGSWNSTRPSDFMLGHLKAFYRATHDERWNTLSDHIVEAIYSLVENACPDTGLLPNFVRSYSGVWKGEEDTYSWDACRVPWRLGIAAMTEDMSSLDKEIKLLNDFALSSSYGEPSGLCCGYSLDGKKLVDYLDPAFAAPFMVSAMRGDDPKFLKKLWNWNSSFSTQVGGYYDNSIRLLCSIAASGQWWTPCREAE